MEQLVGLRLESELWVLLNRSGLRGASGMLRGDLLQDMANKKESDLLILPSSVDEVLLLAWDDIPDMELVKKSVKNTNKYFVDEEDKLSDHVYVFRRKTGELEILSDEE